MTQVVKITDCGPYDLAPGVRMFPLFGDAAMIDLVELDLRLVAAHSHEHGSRALCSPARSR